MLKKLKQINDYILLVYNNSKNIIILIMLILFLVFILKPEKVGKFTSNWINNYKKSYEIVIDTIQ